MRRALLVASLLLLAAAASPRYHVAKTYTVGGEGGWDYLTLDAPSHRLFISRTDRVIVLDVASGKVAGQIANLDGVHGIAIVRDLHRGFITNGRRNSVTIFDLESLRVIGDVKTSERPDAILFEPSSATIFTFNAGGKDSTAITAATGAIRGNVPLGGKPEFAVHDGKGHVFVNIEDTSEVAELDAKTLAIVKRWKLAPCEEPTGLAIDREHRRLFSACSNKTMVISDATAGRIVASVPIGEGVDGAMFDPAYGLAFASNGRSGTLTVVREITPSKYAVADTIRTITGARTMTLDEASHHIYLPAIETIETRPFAIVAGDFVILEVAP